jgi:hypothetical protein
MFDGGLLRNILGPMSEEVTGVGENVMRSFIICGISSPNIFRVMKPGGMRWARHVAHMGKKRNYAGFWRGTSK